MRSIATVVAYCTLTSGSAGSAVASDWQSQFIRDHLKGRIGVGAFVGGAISGDRGKQLGTLDVYCAENSTVVNVASESVYFGTLPVTVRYNLDGGPVQTAPWNYCINGRCVGLWHGQGIPFLKSLFGKKELRMVIELRFASPLNATFNVDGAEAALTDTGQSCGWLPKAPAAKAK